MSFVTYQFSETLISQKHLQQEAGGVLCSSWTDVCSPHAGPLAASLLSFSPINLFCLEPQRSSSWIWSSSCWEHLMKASGRYEFGFRIRCLNEKCFLVFCVQRAHLIQVNQSLLWIVGLLAPAVGWAVQSEEAALQQLKEQVHLVIRSWLETAQPAVHVQPTAQVKQSPSQF